MGVYADDGSLLMTVVDGTEYTSIYAEDGSFNCVEVVGDVYTGVANPCGAYNIVITTDEPGVYHPCGALRVSESPYVESTIKVTLQ